MARERIDWPLYSPDQAAADVAELAAQTSTAQLEAAIGQAALPDPSLGFPDDWLVPERPDGRGAPDGSKEGGSSSDLAIGLGVGLGVGIPAVAASLPALLWWRQRNRRTSSADTLPSCSRGCEAKP